ncbi:MAG: glycosyltransferase family 39 protein [Anaerolineae bacterium]|nr:glycosyltransferase family 39 protein [Anaerolineae bacterium]
MSSTVPLRHPFRDSLLIGALMLYIMAGMALTPFHGDESSTIYMSRDWYTLAWLHNPSALFYRNPPDPKTATDQQLRLVNGPLSYYTTGFAWSLAGMAVSDINDQWLWGADWNYNHDNGHIPGDKLLFVSRLSSTLLTVLSAAVVFAIGRRLAGRQVGWASAFVYATLPIVLLNGRRAMFEGAFMLMIALVLWVGMIVAQKRQRLRWWLLFGLVSGLAITSKHTAILIVIPVFATLLLIGRLRRIGNFLIALVITGFVFLILNPAWWSAPLDVPREVLRLRQELLNGQVEHYGGYTNVADRLVALITQPLGSPQYYEDVQGWPQWIGGQISAYQAGGVLTVGIMWGWFGAVLGVVGVLAFLRSTPTPNPSPIKREGLKGCTAAPLTAAYAIDQRPPPGRRLKGRTAAPLTAAVGKGRGNGGTILFLAVTGFATLALLILTPLAWQRYYVPLAALWAILIGMGLITVWQWVRRYAR